LILSPLLIGLFQRVRRNSYDFTIFYHRNSGQPAFSVFNDKPNRQEAQNFIQQLVKEIERAAPFEDKGEGLAHQLGHLEELRSRGVLSDVEFAAAKQRLLGMGVQEKKIGFSA
jgi:hypothetical protein